jgi:putative glutamine amidotransferase
MKRRPLILVSPDTQSSGAEMQDHSISVGSRYLQALIDAGGIPLSLPLCTDRAFLSDAVRQCDGVMLTGGNDVAPGIYWTDAPKELVSKCECAEPGRDVMELELIQEILAQRKPLLAICRGHQLFNVALGSTLYVDIPSQRPGAFKHSQMDRKYDVVHDVSIEPDSFLASLWNPAPLGVNTTHHQAIDRLAKPLRAVAHGPDGVIEATELRSEDRDLLPWFASVQFHPERLYKQHPRHAALFRAFIAACAT